MLGVGETLMMHSFNSYPWAWLAGLVEAGGLPLESLLYGFLQKEGLASLKLVCSAFSMNESHSSFNCADLFS